jgi:AcrR family transcriptional regulator
VVAEGARMVDESGFEGLTLAALAGRLGVRQPSLYKHIEGMAALRRAIAIGAAAELTEILRRAAVGRSRADAINAIASAQRTWALAHPARYQASQASPPPGDLEHQQIADDYLQLFTDVLSGFGLTDSDAIDAIRAIRSALHGFITFESSGAFAMPYDIDRSYARLVAALVQALGQWSAASDPAPAAGPDAGQRP